MQKPEKNHHILRVIFTKYILQNPINRKLMLPVFFTMIIAKYTEVLGARQTENISKMIKSGETHLSTLLMYSLVYVVSIVLVEIQSFFICRVGQAGYRLANRDTLGYFLDLDPARFNGFGLGEIQNTVLRRSQAVQDMIDVFTLNFFPTFLTILFVSYEVFRGMGWFVVMIINISVVVYLMLTIKITEWRNKMRKKLNAAQNKTSNLMMDSLCNFETIFSYKSIDCELHKYNSSLKNVEYYSTEIARSMYLLNLSQRGVWCAMSICIIFVSCYGSSQRISIEKFTFLIYITGLIMKALDNFGFMYGKYKAAIINAKVNGIEMAECRPDGYRTAFRLNNQIVASNLTIKKGINCIIENASFSIKRGDKVAIIGKNGSGKSTLLKSLIKLNDFEGELMVDNIRLKDLTDASLKSIITFIPQSAILFDDTVMANIKYANGKLFDEEIFRASKEIGTHESIIKLQNGYYTLVGEQGKLLSGGERQKILLLRAILRQSSILLLDESTASLDKESEHKILSSVLKMQNLTVIAIIHNLELISLFNKVLLVNDKKVEEVSQLNVLGDECNDDSIN
ncbi:uncharacterized protein VICG_02019 [Vittaforma corneae ATCC 50505]|uniref:ABC transporter domain-containing protein n=1 Tax=Vittaforma corneae (strain ATCC 50505) TaxID=993615 RepID=L2GK91_VITCO|nr:uncharacterized protein VICG_02019 [Vittaforma corneae ATCC 50505]ELA40930.1 hypothetical protein VICG_02019 [Vittaforma corneae ATCC 50505]